MQLDFRNAVMDVGTFAFNYLRTLAVAGTGGAEISECLDVASRIRSNDVESWVKEWARAGERVLSTAEAATDVVTSRQAYLRASNYYRSAAFPLPATDPRFDTFLTATRECFHQAARRFSPPIETVAIPFGDARLPAYFLSAGAPRRPTLLVLNGGDSTNEEMVHWLGFAAVARGWNCLVFEGPGQWSALQLNPGLVMRPDYEVPVRAVLDYLESRDEVDKDRIALFGPSLGALLGARVLAFEPRIRAGILDGFVVDVHEAWHAVWPKPLQNAPAAAFDFAFRLFERLSPQLRGLANHFRFIFGQDSAKPHEILDGLEPYTVRDLAPRISCPLLIVWGEAEVAQSNDIVARSALRFVEQLSCPVTVRMFGFDEGWAASHCQVGALAPLQALVFGWLDEVLRERPSLPRRDIPRNVGEVLLRYARSEEFKRAARDLVEPGPAGGRRAAHGAAA